MGPPGGIIPALAGNTGLVAAEVVWTRDHPRSRGEYHFILPRYSMNAGSSPLSRGIPAGEAFDQVEERIIPALAGNTAT